MEKFIHFSSHFQGLAWIELHIINPTSRPSPFFSEDLSDELTSQSLIDLIQIVEHKPTAADVQTDNVLRCNVWTRGSQTELDQANISTTLLQAFRFALADYVTEYKLLPTLYNTPRHNSLDPPPSPRLFNSLKLSDETSKEFSLDRTASHARTYTIDNTIPTTPTAQSRRVS